VRIAATEKNINLANFTQLRYYFASTANVSVAGCLNSIQNSHALIDFISTLLFNTAYVSLVPNKLRSMVLILGNCANSGVALYSAIDQD
jgi:hypothetical protein